MKYILIAVAVIILGSISFVAFRNFSANKTKLDSTKKTNSINPIAPLPVSEVLITEALGKYPTEMILKPEFGGISFCSFHLYGYDEEKEKNMVYAYLWAYCEEYYKDGRKIKMGSGVSMPIRVALELQNGILGVQGHEQPEDGEGYAASIRKMFPEKYATDAINGINVETLVPSPKLQAQRYFKTN